jgi:hypothetical protein
MSANRKLRGKSNTRSTSLNDERNNQYEELHNKDEQANEIASNAVEESVTLTISQLRSIIMVEINKAVATLASDLGTRFDYIDTSIDELKSALQAKSANFTKSIADVHDACVKNNSNLEDLETEIKHINTINADQKNVLPPTTSKSTEAEETIQTINELHDRDTRKLNLALFNVIETDATTAAVRLIHDKNLVASLQTKIGTASTVVNARRIGMRRDNHIRPLICTFSSVDDKISMLKAARNLGKLENTDTFKRIIIKPDLTKIQQTEEKKLLDELKIKRANGEKVFIRRGKIIPDNRV